MKRILIAQVARFERQRRMASAQQRQERAGLSIPERESPYGVEGSRALETSALSSLMLALAYRR